MKKQLLSFTILLLSICAQAQVFPGVFFKDVGYAYTTTSVSPCAIDSSFYTIRYGGVERYSVATDTVDYLWNRFYKTTVIKAAPASSLILLKANRIYRYFPASDSMVYLSDSLPSTPIYDVDASAHAIWATVAFDEIGRYDSSGWHIISLGSSINPFHIIAQSDTSAYVADNSGLWLYTPSGLSSMLYSFATSTSLQEWAVDTNGNLWMIADNILTRRNAMGQVTTFNSGNSTINATASFIHIAIDRSGTVWAATSDNLLLRYKNASWNGYGINLPQTAQALAADRTTGYVFVQMWGTIYAAPNGSFSPHSFGNMPYQHIQAVSPTNIATNQGIFTYNGQSFSPDLIPTAFVDTLTMAYASDVTCFTVCTTQAESGYGTHHGVFYTTPPINNIALPDTNINYLYYAMGSYYIGTDKGLCIYNQVVYTTFDTSNSALPSNKVTFVISYQSPYTSAQELWVGTDKGVALYTNGLWTRFDTSVIHMPTFNVTGILPCPYYYYNADSTVWVTTLGDGMVKIKRDNTFKIYNTANGKMRDDSLYFITQNYECSYSGTAYVGTESHGIAYLDTYADTFIYHQQVYYNGGSLMIHRSNLYAVGTQYTGSALFVTDEGINLAAMCIREGIADVSTADQPIIWYQESDDRLRITLPAVYTGTSTIRLYDLTGREVISTTQQLSADHIAHIDISALSTGVYLLHSSDASHSSNTKIAISK